MLSSVKLSQAMLS